MLYDNAATVFVFFYLWRLFHRMKLKKNQPTQLTDGLMICVCVCCVSCDTVDVVVMRHSGVLIRHSNVARCTNTQQKKERKKKKLSFPFGRKIRIFNFLSFSSFPQDLFIVYEAITTNPHVIGVLGHGNNCTVFEVILNAINAIIKFHIHCHCHCQCHFTKQQNIFNFIWRKVT